MDKVVEIKICRLCANPTVITFSLLKEPLRDMFETLTSLKVGECGKLSEACVKCCSNLKLAYMIRKSILKADAKLREMPSVASVKKEISPPDESIIIIDDKCNVCFEKVDNDSKTEHARSHFEKPHRCDTCDEEFANFSLYKQHFLKNHPTQGLFMCGICGRHFKYGSLFKQHTDKAHQRMSISSFVEGRNQEVICKRLADEGIGKKLAEKLIVHSKFDLLKARTKRKIKVADDFPDAFTCDKCPRKFATLEQFNRHMHGRRPCHICKKEISSSNLTAHIKSHTRSPQVCQYCGGTYSNINSLRGHIKYHHDIRIYKCTECNLEFNHRQRLYKHKTTVHGLPQHICDICGKRFFTSSSLKKHVAGTHHQKRPYVCEFCNQGFRSKFGMTTHRRKHTNEAPYKCHVCGEGFRQNVSMKNHLRRRHNITEKITTECKVCGRGFASEHGLKSHMRTHE